MNHGFIREIGPWPAPGLSDQPRSALYPCSRAGEESLEKQCADTQHFRLPFTVYRPLPLPRSTQLDTVLCFIHDEFQRLKLYLTHTVDAVPSKGSFSMLPGGAGD